MSPLAVMETIEAIKIAVRDVCWSGVWVKDLFKVDLGLVFLSVRCVRVATSITQILSTFF